MHKLVFENQTELVVQPLEGDQAAMVMARPHPDGGKRRLITHCRMTTEDFAIVRRRATVSDWRTLETWSDPAFNHLGKLTLNPLPEFVALFDRCWPGGDSPTLEWLIENGALVPHEAVLALFQPTTAASIFCS